jgi:DNA-binding response OmpR family regulator
MAKQVRILIIEDDTGTMNLLEQIVMRAGYEPVLAHGGQAGLRLLQETDIDLILLDIRMKDVDGWTVLMTLKADPRFSDIPVLIVSAKTPAEHPSRMEALADLYEDYFVKPFEVDDLIARIAQVLKTRSMG